MALSFSPGAEEVEASERNRPLVGQEHVPALRDGIHLTKAAIMPTESGTTAVEETAFEAKSKSFFRRPQAVLSRVVHVSGKFQCWAASKLLPSQTRCPRPACGAGSARAPASALRCTAQQVLKASQPRWCRRLP